MVSRHDAPDDLNAPDVTAITGLEARLAARRQVHDSARHLIRTLVDFLAEDEVEQTGFRPIGQVGNIVLARSGALAAARQFISNCEAGE